MAAGILFLIPFALMLIGFPFLIWFMVRFISLMQRIALELESIARSL